jgi:hypothetical protein
MPRKKQPSVAPILRSVSVSWSQDEAYRRFTLSSASAGSSSEKAWAKWRTRYF